MEEKAKKKKGPEPNQSYAFKRQIAQEYYSGKETAKELAVRYGLTNDNSVRQIAHWCKAQGDDFSHLPGPLTEEERKNLPILQKRVQELERLLEVERLKTLGLETMMDIAKKELGIDVRKKSATKQSKP